MKRLRCVVIHPVYKPGYCSRRFIVNTFNKSCFIYLNCRCACCRSIHNIIWRKCPLCLIIARIGSSIGSVPCKRTFNINIICIVTQFAGHRNLIYFFAVSNLVLVKIRIARRHKFIFCTYRYCDSKISVVLRNYLYLNCGDFFRSFCINHFDRNRQNTVWVNAYSAVVNVSFVYTAYALQFITRCSVIKSVRQLFQKLRNIICVCVCNAVSDNQSTVIGFIARRQGGFVDLERLIIQLRAVQRKVLLGLAVLKDIALILQLDGEGDGFFLFAGIGGIIVGVEHLIICTLS